MELIAIMAANIELLFMTLVRVSGVMGLSHDLLRQPAGHYQPEHRQHIPVWYHPGFRVFVACLRDA